MCIRLTEGLKCTKAPCGAFFCKSGFGVKITPKNESKDYIGPPGPFVIVSFGSGIPGPSAFNVGSSVGSTAGARPG